MIYLASPYSHPNPQVVSERFMQTQHCTQLLLLRGLPVFSPIVHCHVITQAYSMPSDAAYWERYNTAFIRKADAVYVLTIDGWQESLGVTQEIGLAKKLGIPLAAVNAMGLEQLEVAFE